MLKVAAGGASGSLNYQGTWNANTNTPNLQSGIGTKGYYYLVSVAGTTNLDGITDWQVNDWAVFNGSVWQKVDNSEAVVSVNGQTGAVNLTAVNVGATPNTTYVIAGTGISGGGQLTGNVTITNAGVLSFNTRTGNVTLDSADVVAALGYTPGTGNGTVTSVGGTAPISSSGGTTPNISIALANATTNGYLSSTDWNTFNNKQPAGTYVTSVTGTSPIASSGGTTPAISIPAANATTDGYLSSADWSTFNAKGVGNVTTVNTGTGLTGGPITGTGTISIANTTVNAGSYGAADTVSQVTFNAQGQATAAANVAIAINVAAVSGAVPNTRAINSGTGLTGGGDLSADRTLSVVANSTQQLVGVQNNGVDVATRQIINFVPGSGITLSGADGTTRSNVTISVTTPLPSPGTAGNVLTSTGSAWTSNALPATGISITDDTTSNSTRYITMTANTSGQITTENVSSTKFYFNPSTGQTSSSLFSSENGIFINKNNVTSNVTIGSGYNAMSAGTVTISNGVSVTVGSGSRWVVL
jgi:trimeric autotransporter adhesin